MPIMVEDGTSRYLLREDVVASDGRLSSSGADITGKDT